MRFIFRYIIIALMAMLLSGCGFNKLNDSKEDEALVMAAASDAKYAPVALEDIKAGFIFTGAAETEGFDMLIKNGMLSEQLLMVESIAVDDEEGFVNAYRHLSECGCVVIFATDGGYAECCDKMSQEIPDVLVACKDATGNGFNNYIGYMVNDPGDFYCRVIQTIIDGNWNGKDYYDE